MDKLVRNVGALALAGLVGILAYRIPAYLEDRSGRMRSNRSIYESWGAQSHNPLRPEKIETCYDDPAQSDLEISALSWWEYIIDPSSSKWDADSTERLTHHPANDDEGAWSPDGRRVAYVSERHVPELGRGADDDLARLRQSMLALKEKYDGKLPDSAMQRTEAFQNEYDRIRAEQFRWHLVVAEPSNGGWTHRQLTHGDLNIHDPYWYADGEGSLRIRAYDEKNERYVDVNPETGELRVSELLYGVRPGSPAPGFTLEDFFSGEPSSLSDYKGRPVVLTVFESWCEPCKPEIRILDTVAATYSPSVAFLALTSDDAHETKGYLESLGVSNLTVLVDTAEDDRGERTGATIRSLYSGGRIPVTVIIGSDGFIKRFHHGNRFVVDDRGESIRETLDAMLR